MHIMTVGGKKKEFRVSIALICDSNGISDKHVDLYKIDKPIQDSIFF